MPTYVLVGYRPLGEKPERRYGCEPGATVPGPPYERVEWEEDHGPREQPSPGWPHGRATWKPIKSFSSRGLLAGEVRIKGVEDGST